MAQAVGSADPGNRRFLRHATVATSWGEGLDGFDLGIISVVIAAISTDLHMSVAVVGLIGASSLIGIFVGAPIFGRLTDRYGRRLMYIIDILVFLLAGVLQAFATDGITLFILRLILGLAIGAEYAIGAPMLAEFAPAKDRGFRLALLEMCWYVGFLLAVVLGYLLEWAGLGWRWILATSAIPAAITLIMRIGLPESPRWLLRQGRQAEAHEIIDTYLGGEKYYEDEDLADETASDAGIGKLFSRGVRGRTVFVCVFWACLVAPYFAIFTFAPEVMTSLKLTDPRASTIATNGIAALGAVVGIFFVERMGRRRMLIIPFWIQSITLLVVGVWTGAPAWLVVACFALYAFFNAFAGDLTSVYPAEIFDTDVRTSGVGLASAASRVGAAVGTWLLPLMLEHLGVRASMLVFAVICLIGTVVSHAMAPETTGRTLSKASAGGFPGRAEARRQG